MKRFFLLLSAILFLAGCKNASDIKEEAALRSQCHVPGYAALREFRRLSDAPKGGGLAARYHLKPQDVARFEAFIRSDGWRELSKPSMEPRFGGASHGSSSKARHGFVRFEKEGEPHVSGETVILSVYNEESRELLAVARPIP